MVLGQAQVGPKALSTTTDRPPAMCVQVEFYFSDSNVPRDNFLLGKIEEDPEVRAAALGAHEEPPEQYECSGLRSHLPHAGLCGPGPALQLQPHGGGPGHPQECQEGGESQRGEGCRGENMARCPMHAWQDSSTKCMAQGG